MTNNCKKGKRVELKRRTPEEAAARALLKLSEMRLRLHAAESVCQWLEGVNLSEHELLKHGLGALLKAHLDTWRHRKEASEKP